MCGYLSCTPKWGVQSPGSTTQACALTGNGTSDPLVHRPVLSPLSHTSQGCIFNLQIAVIWRYSILGENDPPPSFFK